MRITKVFKCGNSLAVRIPKEFCLATEEVEIFKRNNGDIIIRRKTKKLAKAFTLLTQLPKDFFAEGRNDTSPQSRDF